MAATNDNFNERLAAIVETLGLAAGMQLATEKRIDNLLDPLRRTVSISTL